MRRGVPLVYAFKVEILYKKRSDFHLFSNTLNQNVLLTMMNVWNLYFIYLIIIMKQ